ncbi:MAG: Crp/Fnr family transcriptional regulator [Sphaerochaetaceae bacterium]
MKETIVFNPEILDTFIKGGNAQQVTYAKGFIIALQGDRCVTLDLIQKGSLALENIDEEGRLFVAQIFYPGEMCGATLLFGSSNIYPMQVVAHTETTLLRLSKKAVLSLCEQDEGVLLSLLRVISDRAHQLGTTVNRLSTLTLRESLLDHLFMLSSRQQTSSVVLPTSKKELAEYLGFARTSVSRELAALEKEGRLTVHGRTIELHDL